MPDETLVDRVGIVDLEPGFGAGGHVAEREQRDVNVRSLVGTTNTMTDGRIAATQSSTLDSNKR